MFWKIQEILYLIDTKIFQFDLLEAEKFGSEVDNPSLKILEKKGWKILNIIVQNKIITLQGQGVQNISSLKKFKFF